MKYEFDKPNLKQVPFMLTQQQRMKLKEKAGKENVSQASIIRRLINDMQI